jgi:hypothetical protein
MCEAKWMEITEGRRLHSEKEAFCSVLLSRKQNDRFSENMMGGTCNTHGNEEKRSVLDGKPEGAVCLGAIIVDG